MRQHTHNALSWPCVAIWLTDIDKGKKGIIRRGLSASLTATGERLTVWFLGLLMELEVSKKDTGALCPPPLLWLHPYPTLSQLSKTYVIEYECVWCE